ncbi:hypothetical protein JOF56_001782 [Kibdelosporangium banguiense]|uniref:Uncharacterized protein n=1 Tax=Kibdelosporangium banguiense TaxID=1365924 RepID=A0ABS4TAE8_9PSEU|nr:hypothetical protein [Kibdelosporangium banguiense]MBP2321397.1 hypothetical protein [Kibdelosporangium banguiense]
MNGQALQTVLMGIADKLTQPDTVTQAARTFTALLSGMDDPRASEVAGMLSEHAKQADAFEASAERSRAAVQQLAASLLDAR